MVDVAQLVRASVCGAEGRRFEPGLPPQKSLAGCEAFFFIKKNRPDFIGSIFCFYFFLKISKPKILTTKIDNAVSTVTKSRIGFPAHSKYKNLCRSAKV